MGHGQGKESGVNEVDIVICIVTSVLTATVTTKILATHYFKIVDGYVKDICDKTDKFMERVKSEVDNFL